MSLARLALAALACAPLALAAPAARAQPAGSYRATCRDIQSSSGRLTATCGSMRGNLRTSTLDVTRCQGDIGNNDGVLACAGATASNVRDAGRNDDRGGGSDRGGSYDRGGYDRGNYDRGGYDRGGYDRGGSGRGGGVTLFSEPGFRGQAFEVRGDEENLANRGFNDRARSARVNGGGRWRLCAQSGYRNCQILSGDVDDLRRIGLADSVSSVERSN